jgi:nitrite reductase (NADH) large subunit
LCGQGERIVDNGRLITTEGPPPYYRLNLTRYLAGEIGMEALPIHPPEWYVDNRIDLLAGARTETLDLENARVIVDGHDGLSFDRLVLATGAHPFVPPRFRPALDTRRR